MKCHPTVECFFFDTRVWKAFLPYLFVVANCDDPTGTACSSPIKPDLWYGASQWNLHKQLFGLRFQSNCPELNSLALFWHCVLRWLDTLGISGVTPWFLCPQIFLGWAYIAQLLAVWYQQREGNIHCRHFPSCGSHREACSISVEVLPHSLTYPWVFFHRAVPRSSRL